MKQLYILSIIVIFATSCEKYLEVEPYNRKVVGNFYKTPEDGLEALTAAYDVLQWGYYDNIILMSEISSDNCYGGAGKSDDQRLQAWDDFIVTPFSNEEPWKKYYTGIYRANIFLQNVDNIEWGDKPELQDRYMAEARFLRAYYYFDLVRIYGYVPLLKTVVEVDELFIPQADPDDVYALIAEDLVYAAEHLDPIPYQSIPPAEYGRITKWAAEALLARVYLYYTGYYNQPDLAGIVTKNEIRTYIDDVIDNSGHDLVNNFANLWAQALDDYIGEDNIETVFAIKYTYKAFGNINMKDGNQFQSMIGLRTQNLPPYGTGWGAGTVNPALWNDYEEGDMRKEVTIINLETVTYVDENDSVYTFDDSDQREYTGYCWKKFMPIAISRTKTLTQDLGGNSIRDNPDDYPVIRFSDVLLMGAELHMDENLSIAQQYLDRVRDRAFQDDQHRVTLTNDQSGLSIIREERRLELALEGHRYWDLLRADGLAGNLGIANQAIDCTEPYPVDFRAETEGLFMIPETQITLSKGTLVQNPGWN
jgi:starch-binding outer membrane protein, SusD/RagB family